MVKCLYDENVKNASKIVPPARVTLVVETRLVRDSHVNGY